MPEHRVPGRRVPGRRVPVPRGVGVRAAEVASGQRSVAQPREAATVVLIRPAQEMQMLEVLMLARARAMDFAPGAHVFPGGSVDADDAGVPWEGPAPEGLGVPDERARALVCAAVRETFEESGVLLAGAPDGLAGAPDAEDRRALLAGEVSFGDLLTRGGLALRADLVTPWARWITPEAADRRFDTWFFAAAMPDGQDASASAESDSIAWVRPQDALEAARAGQLTLLPPTAVTLAEIGGYADPLAVLAARREVTPLMPVVEVEDGQAWLTMPDGAEYPL
jgi:8-oxo-dGTP pyrophosphatase MutT (NUDIX family)